MQCELEKLSTRCRTGGSAAIAGQLVRCGTAAGPNYEEGCAAESRDDFIHKLRISLKELRATHYWLRFIVRAELLPDRRLQPLVLETEELCKIVGASVTTANENRTKNPR